ncbi:MAG: IS4 family transposase [Symploca sp. SIO1C2]|nr:IS4 family transposase [Symploca sp. SIO1C2]
MSTLLPSFYKSTLKNKLKRSEYLICLIIIGLLQTYQISTIEELDNKFPSPILFESRRKKIQRFLSLYHLNFSTIWFPILSIWLSLNFSPLSVLYLAIDRTEWTGVNLLFVSIIYQKRAIPIYVTILQKKGASNFREQQEVLAKILPLFNNYKKVVLGDREFCSVGLAQWLREQPETYFCLRLKKNEYVEIKENIWMQLKDLAPNPGVNFYLQGVKITKTKGFCQGEVAGKWARKYRDKKSSEDAWFISTNLGDFSQAINSYQKRFGIEELFRDIKSGGYQIDKTLAHGDRLMSLLLLITLAYSSALLTGEKIQQKRKIKYVSRIKEKKRYVKRHSYFYIGLHGKDWVESLNYFEKIAESLMSLSPHKRPNYKRGNRAATLIKSTL